MPNERIWIVYGFVSPFSLSVHRLSSIFVCRSFSGRIFCSSFYVLSFSSIQFRSVTVTMFDLLVFLMCIEQIDRLQMASGAGAFFNV